MGTLRLWIADKPRDYNIAIGGHDAIDLIRQFKTEKKATNLGALGGSELVFVDWKKIPIIEVIDSEPDLSEKF